MEIPKAAPLVTVYVRHSASCGHAKESAGANTGEFAKGCKCRKWLRYSAKGKQYRYPTKTRSWAEAEKQAKKIFNMLGGDPLATALHVATQESAEKPKTIEQAIELFASKKRSKGCKEAGVRKYERELKRLSAFFAANGKLFVKEISEELLIEYRADFNKLYPSTQTQQKVQERLRSFLKLCHRNGWLIRLPELDAIIQNEVPTLPLNAKQYEHLLKGADKVFSGERARKIRALIQLMKYSGLAIVDAVSLEKQEIQHDAKLKCYRIVTSRTKTGVTSLCPFPTLWRRK